MQLPAAVYTTDAAGVITFFNRAAVELWGREPRVGVDVWCGSWRIFDADGQPMPLDACPMAQCLRQGHALPGIEIIIERPDGSRRHVLPHPVPLRDRAGVLVGATNLLFDIGARVAADDASRRLAALVAWSDDAIISKNLDGVIMTWNRGAERLFGYSESEAVGQPVTILIPDDRLEEETEIIDRIRRGEPVDHYETLRRRKDGSLVVVSLTVSPIRDGRGRVVGASKIARDITDWRRVQAELERARDEAQAASRAKDAFIATLSHELRTPLNPALVISSDALQRTDLPEDVRADFATIHEQVQLEARLIDDMLDLTRISRGMLELARAPLQPEAVLRAAVAVTEREFAAKDLRLELRLHAPDCELAGDAVRLQQVFWNLLRNAAKFTPPGGRITVTTGVENGGNRFVASIADTGIGMSADEMRRVFEPYVQGEHASNGHRRQFEGLGLGLAISREIVAAHGGTLSATSTGRGAGSTFCVRLPCTMVSGDARPERDARDEGAESPRAVGSRSGRNSLDVLLVDDHRPTCRAVERFLLRRGHRVTVATSLAEARARIAGVRIDVLISDIGLPDGTGYELMGEVRCRQPQVCGIAVSGYGMADDVEQARAAGFVEHFTKPLDVARLESVLAALAAGG